MLKKGRIFLYPKYFGLFGWLKLVVQMFDAAAIKRGCYLTIMIMCNDTSVSDWWKCLLASNIFHILCMQGGFCPVMASFLVALLTPSFWRNLCQSGIFWCVFPSTFLVWISFRSQSNRMILPQYEEICALWDVSSFWNFFHTLHTCALHGHYAVCYVQRDCLPGWKTSCR